MAATLAAALLLFAPCRAEETVNLGLSGGDGAAGEPPFVGVPTSAEHIEGAGRESAGPPDLANATVQAAAGRGSHSGFVVLESGKEALRERLALIEAAERSIDLQYYIWNSDLTGRYVAERVLAAAERGVRVRVLLDDINTRGRDCVLAALDSHPDIEIRLYNPIAGRSGARRLWGFARDFTRVNRRMHNKSLTVDAAATVIGGRNIGDEYFDAHREVNFLDRDLLAVGPVVRQAQEAFEVFWNSAWSRPVTELTRKKLDDTELNVRRVRVAASKDELASLGYSFFWSPADAHAHLSATFRELVWAPAELVFDAPPASGEIEASSDPGAVASKLAGLADGARREVLIESAYFIPGDRALDLFSALRGRGVRVSALTNSLASNDLTTNHSGYARRRRGIVQAGVALHELRPDAASCRTLTPERCAQGALLSLHAKSIVFDRRLVYVGSFNLNLRSAFLNTETALIVDSPELADRIARSIEQNLDAENSWRVELDEAGNAQWVTARQGVEQRSTHEPATGWRRRAAAGFFRMWPLEKYL